MAVSEGSYGTVVQYYDDYLNFTGVLRTNRSSLHLATAKLGGIVELYSSQTQSAKNCHIDFKHR